MKKPVADETGVTVGRATDGLPAIEEPVLVLGEEDFRDRVYACWLGKNIGGTLGMPVEGSRDLHDFTFFTPVPTVPAANDDLDLQILWLKVLEERGTRIGAVDLGDYWLKYVPVDWNEYGVGKMNMRRGFAPPLSGQYANQQWRNSNGAWIRSEIWACLAPGCPALAARYAWEDACVDHGTAEGTYAELFTATLESAAFVEKDRERLLAIALSYIPRDCGVARSVRAAMDSFRRGLSLREARAAVLEASKDTGWFQAPQNVAFTILGWYYGEGDFGKSICAAVNCGDDTDCTGATLGSLWGILHGSAGIPERWRKPVGEGIQNVAISGFKAPASLSELTDRTVAMAHRVLRERNQPVRITPGGVTSIKPAARARLVDSKTARELWARSPYRITYRAAGLEAVLDYGRDPEVEAGTPRALTLRLTNTASTRRSLRVQWIAESPLSCPAAPKTLSLAPGASESLSGNVTLARETRTPARGSIRVSEGSRALLEVPFALLSGSGVRKGDVALARLGATATCDSELDREPGCAAKAIDGEVVEGGAFEGRRWHSALTPHPHWLSVTLPNASVVSRAIIHFADPGGHPVDFDLQASDDGAAWRTVAEQRGCQSQDFAELQFPATTARHFRLVILRSASATYPNAAQISELELLP